MITKLKYGYVLRDRNLRKNYRVNIEISKNVLKSLLQSENYLFTFRLYFSKMFYIFKSSSAISKYSTYCVFSNSGRTVYRQFKLSRLFCKYFASHGFLLGLRKSSF